MALKNPVVIYTAGTNVEAQLLSVLLTENGVEAYAAEDVAAGGYWMGGNLPGIHKPQVWVDAADVDRAAPLLEQYKTSTLERAKEPGPPGKQPMMDVVCEECGKTSQFPIDLLGSIQDCPHCGAYVDVGEVDETGAWDDGEEEDGDFDEDEDEEE